MIEGSLAPVAATADRSAVDARAAGRASADPGPLLTAGVAVATAAVVGALVYRLRFGVELAAEGLYVALPYRFVLGDRPFVDETSAVQSAALLTQPLVASYLSWRGSTDGLVLFLRQAHLAFGLGVAVLVAAVLARVTRWQYGWLAALACPAFVPFMLPNFSYNTIGAGCFAAGSLLGGVSLLEPRARLAPAAAGVLHATAALAYPPLAAALAVYALALLAIAKPRERSAAFTYLAGLTVACGALTALLLAHGAENLIRTAAISSEYGPQGGGATKLRTLGRDALRDLGAQPGLMIAATLLAIGLALNRTGSRRLAAVGALLVPLAIVSSERRGAASQGLLYTYHAGLAAVAFLAWKGLQPRVRALLVLLLVASFAAALVTAYVSSNGLANAGLGAMPALLVAGALSAELLRSAVSEHRAAEAANRWRAPLAFLLPALPLLATVGRLLFDYYGVVYPDERMAEQTMRVERGPFAGLWTTPERADFVTDLQRDLEAALMPGDRIIFYDDLPAGYLMTSARPATSSLWLFDQRNRTGGHPTEIVLDYFEREGVEPTVLVRNRWYARARRPHPLDRFFAPAFSTVVDRPLYTISRRNE